MPVYDKNTSYSFNGYLNDDFKESRRGEVEFFLSYSDFLRGWGKSYSLLELACGAGRVMTEFAKMGFEVYGIDASWHMLDIGNNARKNLPKDVQQRMHFIQGDMCNFALKKQFRLIIIPYHSFWYNLNEVGAEQCLSCISDHLEHEAIFIIDQPQFPAINFFSLSKDALSRRKWWTEMAEKYDFIFEIRPYCASRSVNLSMHLLNSNMLIGQKFLRK